MGTVIVLLIGRGLLYYKLITKKQTEKMRLAVEHQDKWFEDIIEKEKDSEESRNVVNAKKDDQGRKHEKDCHGKSRPEGEETVITKWKGTGSTAAIAGNTKPGPDGGDDDGNTTTATAFFLVQQQKQFMSLMQGLI